MHCVILKEQSIRRRNDTGTQNCKNAIYRAVECWIPPLSLSPHRQKIYINVGVKRYFTDNRVLSPLKT